MTYATKRKIRRWREALEDLIAGAIIGCGISMAGMYLLVGEGFFSVFGG